MDGSIASRNGIMFDCLHYLGKLLTLMIACVVEDWRGRLKCLCQGSYHLRDIFNADETGLFYRDLSMTIKGETVKGGKKSKERITALLACSAEGEKLVPLVIGHSVNPRCFKGLASLPVSYSSNKKAWMTSELFQRFT